MTSNLRDVLADMRDNPEETAAILANGPVQPESGLSGISRRRRCARRDELAT